MTKRSFKPGDRVTRTQKAQQRLRSLGLDFRGMDLAVGGEVVRQNNLLPEFYGVRWDNDSAIHQVHERLIEEE